MKRSVATKYPSNAPAVTTMSMAASISLRPGLFVVAKK